MCFGGEVKSTISRKLLTLGRESETNFSGLMSWFVEAVAGSLKARKANTDRFSSGRHSSSSRFEIGMAVTIWVRRMVDFIPRISRNKEHRPQRCPLFAIYQ